ncbi:hypothetical protein MSG28_016050 [Choristoneura fumiferana]|uniref:Uncharacterized protein n=1 Tax=Choristoneura fumiferana TaxID=7141 RepID=A0ACC0K5M5_CHOFU|nr:hypothetical protein MSG28_016050 [Choristoneura fumiferana]
MHSNWNPAAKWELLRKLSDDTDLKSVLYEIYRAKHENVEVEIAVATCKPAGNSGAGAGNGAVTKYVESGDQNSSSNDNSEGASGSQAEVGNAGRKSVESSSIRDEKDY